MSLERRLYVRHVLDLYRALAGDHARPRRQDRLLAEQLYEQGVPLELIQAAIRLAMARRNARPEHATPLQPVRSLHYFRPIVEELRGEPRLDDYLRYLRERAEDHCRNETGGVQISTLLRDR